MASPEPRLSKTADRPELVEGLSCSWAQVGQGFDKLSPTLCPKAFLFLCSPALARRARAGSSRSWSPRAPHPPAARSSLRSTCVRSRLARLLAEPGRRRPADGRAVAASQGLRRRPAALSGASAADRRRPHELRLRARLCRARAAEGAVGCARHNPGPRPGTLAGLHRQDLRARARRVVARFAGGQRNPEPRAVR